MKMTTFLMLNIASIVEKADENVLPAVYFFLGRSLHASLSDLGTLTLCRAMVQAVASPLCGILGDQFNRTHVIAIGCVLWGVMTSAIGASTSLRQSMVAAGVNGLGLAMVIPSLSSIIADTNDLQARGQAFGTVSLTSSLGGMAGGFFATNIGGKSIMGLEGWRVAFHIIAGVSVATGFLVIRFAHDPRCHPSKPRQPLENGYKNGAPPVNNPMRLESRANIGVWESTRTVLKIPSFLGLVLQGIVGTIPWTAMVMFTLWLQLQGFTDLEASSLMALFTFGCAIGSLFGGMLGDVAARRSPSHGRILVAQFSVFSGLPLSFLLLKALPSMAPGASLPFGAVLLLLGLSVSWCGSNNSCLFAELVPESLRTQIYAFDRSFEGAIGACGAPLVGITAERLFGFKSGSVAEASGSSTKQTAAMSNALLVCLVVPWTLCLGFYSFLHWTYPRDKAMAAKALLRKSGSELELGSARTAALSRGIGIGKQPSPRRRLIERIFRKSDTL